MHLRSDQDLPARCHHGNCAAAKIDEYARRICDLDYDKWGAADDLAFLSRFVGDIHQPLHAVTNADLGGTCQQVNVTRFSDVALLDFAARSFLLMNFAQDLMYGFWSWQCAPWIKLAVAVFVEAGASYVK